MKLLLHVVILSIFFSPSAYPNELFEFDSDSDKVLTDSDAYQSCREALEGALAFYIEQQGEVRQLVNKSIDCKCKQIATRIAQPAGSYPAGYDYDTAQSRAEQLEADDRLCLPTSPWHSDQSDKHTGN